MYCMSEPLAQTYFSQSPIINMALTASRFSVIFYDDNDDGKDLLAINNDIQT